MSTPAVAGVTAFERLLASVERLIGGSRLSIEDLANTAVPIDRTYIAKETGHSEDDVSRLVLSFTLADELIPPGKPVDQPVKKTRAPRVVPSAATRQEELVKYASVVYAVLGQYRDADLSGLAGLDEPRVKASVDVAIDAGFVPKSAASVIPSFLASLHATRIARFLDEPELAAESPLVAIAIQALAPPSPVRTAVAELALQHGANPTAFWRGLDADARVPGDVRRALHVSADVLEISDRNVGLLAALTTNGTGAGSLDASRLVALDPKDWLRLTSEGEPTDDGALGPATAAAARYARTLAEATERRYPNEKFRYELSRDKGRGTSVAAARRDILTFLDNNADFHLLDTPVASLLTGDKKLDAPRLKGIRKPDDTIRLMTSYQRIQRLLPELADVATTVAPAGDDLGIDSRYAVVTHLVDDGFTSAIQIAAIPRFEFIDRYTGKLGKREVVEEIYRRSETITDASLQLAILVKGWSEREVPRALPRAVTWAETFGAQESCECGHCLSIHSPAAYLFDCLRFLEEAGAQAQAATPLASLKARRGDLLEVALTCANTNTRIPYIDLVNELLEKLIVPTWFQPFAVPASAAQALADRTVNQAIRDAFRNSANAISLALEVEVYPLNASTWHLLDQATLYLIRKTGATIRVESASFQTAGPEDELRAMPQHVIPAAYQMLERKVFPWRAPFVLAWTEINEYPTQDRRSAGRDSRRVRATVDADHVEDQSVRGAGCGSGQLPWSLSSGIPDYRRAEDRG